MLLAVTAAALLAVPSHSSAFPLRAGTYAGTVTTSLAVGKNHLPATLRGTWTLTVRSNGQVSGTEDMRGPVSFTSPDDEHCTYRPATWTFGSKGTLGSASVKGNALVVGVSDAWYSVPLNYVRTCAGHDSRWPLTVVYIGGGDTVTPAMGSLSLPLALFTKAGRKATIVFRNTWGTRFARTYTLTRAPGR